MEQGIVLLPKRSRKAKPVKNWRECEFLTNFYDIELDKKASLYQFVFDSEPKIEDDSRVILYEIINSIRSILKVEIGLFSFKGKTLWGRKNLNHPYTSNVIFNNITYEVIIKSTKEISTFDLLKSKESIGIVLQAYNIALKLKLKNLDMVEVSRGKYFNKTDLAKQNIIKEHGLQAVRGYVFTLCQLNRGLSLQIDLCTRILLLQNFLETINKCKSKEQVLNYIGHIVLTNYGNNKTYRIEDISFDLTPRSEFFRKDQKGKISYEKYYEEAYGVYIKDKKQPLLKVVTKIDKKILENGSIERNINYGYLIPELVRLTGIPDEKKDNNRIMRDIAEFTKMPPGTRHGDTDKFKNLLNKEAGSLVIKDAIKVGGYVLPQVAILLNENSKKRSENGSLNIKESLKEPMTLKKCKWIFAYSSLDEESSDKDHDDADQAVRHFKKAQGMFGIRIEEPAYVVVKGKGVEEWKNNLKKHYQDDDIVVLFFTNYESKYYGELKRFLINQLKVQSQVVLRKTLNSKNPLPAASKIICQMNSKVGKTLWEVQRSHDFWAGKKVAYGALAISKGAKGHTLAFVGTTNKEMTKIYSETKVGIEKKQNIPPQLLNDFFANWLKAYDSHQNDFPQIIILYREGLAESQIKAQSQVEINALNYTIDRARKKRQGYSPQVMYIVVNKKINSRFYISNQKEEERGKFQPKIENPDPGSIIFQEISSREAYDFHLAAQKVTQGTCTPTHYRIAYDASQIPQEAIAQLTYEQCYNYYNWSGAVRVPACLQCADKLSKLVGEHVKADIEKSDLQKTHFFL